jgi:hypothetical protein
MQEGRTDGRKEGHERMQDMKDGRKEGHEGRGRMKEGRVRRTDHGANHKDRK